MNGLCRELMSALLSSDEATDVDYEPAEHERNGGRHGKKIVTLFGRMPKLMIYISDGGKWTQTVRKNEFPFAKEILDLYHAIEHLKPLLLGLGFKEGTERYRHLHKYWTDRIKAGKIESVLKSIWDGKYGNLTKAAMREFKYFRSNKDRMKYDEYRKNGWFYGSGAMESGCKCVVGQRFKQSAAWTNWNVSE